MDCAAGTDGCELLMGTRVRGRTTVESRVRRRRKSGLAAHSKHLGSLLKLNLSRGYTSRRDISHKSGRKFQVHQFETGLICPE